MSTKNKFKKFKKCAVTWAKINKKEISLEVRARGSTRELEILSSAITKEEE
jgi:hypothetical protein